MRDAPFAAIDLAALDRQADTAAARFDKTFPRAAAYIFDLLAHLDGIDADIFRANARLPPTARRILPASARIRSSDVRHARSLWAATIAAIPFTPPARRRA